MSHVTAMAKTCDQSMRSARRRRSIEEVKGGKDAEDAREAAGDAAMEAGLATANHVHI